MPQITHQFATTASSDSIRAALTTLKGLTGWWARDADVGQGVGSTHELRFDKDGRTVVMRFRVDAIDTDRVGWTCTDNGNPVWVGTSLEWRFGDGNVRFVHDGFAEDQSTPFRMTAEGWKHFGRSLEQYLGSGTGMPW